MSNFFCIVEKINLILESFMRKGPWYQTLSRTGNRFRSCFGGRWWWVSLQVLWCSCSKKRVSWECTEVRIHPNTNGQKTTTVTTNSTRRKKHSFIKLTKITTGRRIFTSNRCWNWRLRKIYIIDSAPTPSTGALDVMWWMCGSRFPVRESVRWRGAARGRWKGRHRGSTLQLHLLEWSE